MAQRTTYKPGAPAKLAPRFDRATTRPDPRPWPPTPLKATTPTDPKEGGHHA